MRLRFAQFARRPSLIISQVCAVEIVLKVRPRTTLSFRTCTAPIEDGVCPKHRHLDPPEIAGTDASVTTTKRCAVPIARHREHGASTVLSRSLFESMPLAEVTNSFRLSHTSKQFPLVMPATRRSAERLCDTVEALSRLFRPETPRSIANSHRSHAHESESETTIVATIVDNSSEKSIFVQRTVQDDRGQAHRMQGHGGVRDSHRAHITPAFPLPPSSVQVHDVLKSGSLQ